MSNIISRETTHDDIDLYIREIDELRFNDDEQEYDISDVNYDILDSWLLMTEEERENAWNNYTEEEREELNELREELKFMLYVGKWDYTIEDLKRHEVPCFKSVNG